MRTLVILAVVAVVVLAVADAKQKNKGPKGPKGLKKGFKKAFKGRCCRFRPESCTWYGIRDMADNREEVCQHLESQRDSFAAILALEEARRDEEHLLWKNACAELKELPAGPVYSEEDIAALTAERDAAQSNLDAIQAQRDEAVAVANEHNYYLLAREEARVVTVTERVYATEPCQGPEGIEAQSCLDALANDPDIPRAQARVDLVKARIAAATADVDETFAPDLEAAGAVLAAAQKALDDALAGNSDLEARRVALEELCSRLTDCRSRHRRELNYAVRKYKCQHRFCARRAKKVCGGSGKVQRDDGEEPEDEEEEEESDSNDSD